jgi:serine protease Do
MRTGTARWILLLVLTQPAVCAFAQALLSPEALYEKLAPSIVMIGTFDAGQRMVGLGSGVVIAPGQVVTNCHVLRKATSVYIRSGDATYRASLRYPDPERDLCQLESKELQLPAAEIGSIRQVRIGQRVYALGNPRGLERTFSDGLVSALRGASDEQLIQTTAPVSPGSSGGGLFDASGRLVGITTLARRDSANIAFAVPADWIAEIPARGSEQLAAYRSRTAPAPAPDGALAEKPLTGKELLNLFRTSLKFRINEPPTLQALEFRTNGYVYAEFSNVTRSGTHQVSNGSNEVCLRMTGPPSRHDSGTGHMLAFLQDCFTVSLISERRYRFMSRDKNFSMIGEI